MLDPGVLAIFIPIVAIVGGIAVAIVGIVRRSRLRELQVRERIAMIEKGLVPPPEVDPQRFEDAMGRLGPYGVNACCRHRRAGITLMGVGFGLMLLIGLSGESVRQAIGVGGFLVVLGLAFLINSLFENRLPAAPPSPPPPPAPPAS